MKRLTFSAIAMAAALASTSAWAESSAHHRGHHAPGASHLGYGDGAYGYSGNEAINGPSRTYTGSPFPRGDRFDENVEPGVAAQKPTLPPLGFDD